jgi:dTDP-4-amino-4,6-dideoxygalactose transaminase
MSNASIRSKDRFLVFGAPVIEDAEIQEVVATLKSGWLGTGPKVSEFEKRFSAYKARHLELRDALALTFEFCFHSKNK